jgi:hypothetical protein
MAPKIVKVTVENDEYASSPCEEDGWKLYSFNTRHIEFRDPRTFINKHRPSIPNIGLLRKLGVGTAFVLSYEEHGLCRWALSGEVQPCQFDTTTVAGLLIWEQPLDDLGPKTYKERQEDARNFLDNYTDWCNGENYNVCVEYEDGATESIGGYTGRDNLIAGLKQEFPEIFKAGKEEIREDIEIDGNQGDVLK